MFFVFFGGFFTTKLYKMSFIVKNIYTHSVVLHNGQVLNKHFKNKSRLFGKYSYAMNTFVI